MAVIFTDNMYGRFANLTLKKLMIHIAPVPLVGTEDSLWADY